MMKSTTTQLRYSLLTYRMDQLWLPAAFWALFAIVIGFLKADRDVFNLAAAFLGITLPLIGGVLAAYAVLEDPALELHFATPRPTRRILLERLGVILGVIVAAALSFQVFLAIVGIDLSGLGGPAARQLAWLIPSLAMIALGSASAFALAQSIAGALSTGLVWLVQVLARNWFLQDAWARYVFLFMGVRAPNHPNLLANQLCLAGLSLLLLWVAWSLFKKQERYL